MPNIRFDLPRASTTPRAFVDGVLVTQSCDTLYISGQVGTDADGNLADDCATQAREIWRKITEILRLGGMDLTDIVKTTVFLVSRDDYAAFSAVRDEVLAGNRPASTLVYVASLVHSRMRIEIEVVAAR